MRREYVDQCTRGVQRSAVRLPLACAGARSNIPCHGSRRCEHTYLYAPRACAYASLGRKSLDVRVGIRNALAVLFGTCLLCAHAAVAQAAEAARLVYGRSADAGTCPDEATLRNAVARRLGYDPFVAYATRTVIVELHGGASGYTGRVYVVDAGTAGGAREITSPGPDCDDLISAVALAISIAVDPASIDAEPIAPEPEPATLPASDSSSRSAHEDSAPDTFDAPEDSRKTDAPPERDDAHSERRTEQKPATAKPVRWSAGAGVFLATGPAPSPDLGIALVAGVVGRHWAFGVEPRIAMPTTSDAQSVPGRVKVTVYGGSLLPCYRYDDWFGCYVLDLASTTASGVNVDVSHSDQALWAAQGLRIAHRWPLGAGFSLGASADGLWAFTRSAFRIDGKDAFETPRLLARFGVDATVDF